MTTVIWAAAGVATRSSAVATSRTADGAMERVMVSLVGWERVRRCWTDGLSLIFGAFNLSQFYRAPIWRPHPKSANQLAVVGTALPH